MFNGMERNKNQNTENKSLLYCHDLRKREPQASNVLKKTEFPKMILKTFQVRKLAFPKKDLIVKKIWSSDDKLTIGVTEVDEAIIIFNYFGSRDDYRWP